ncbi:MAG: hypothetical protein SF182_06645 [Deltaproteobacteria bacterium]|nr:hypothetical protein [Deltaproteobacteria bacterium]
MPAQRSAAGEALRLRAAAPNTGPEPRATSSQLRQILLVAFFLFAAALPAGAQDPFADAVAAYTPGVNGGFGDDLLPDVLLGPPQGAGEVQGSFDVLALGIGGSVTLRFDLPVICDGPGADFTVFENAFHSGSPSGPLFTEYTYVAVSQDGEHFVELPYDAATGIGLAGRTEVFSNSDNGIDPLDPSVSGGDQFDLAGTGFAWVAYVRVTDVGGAIRDFGDLAQFTISPNAGADIDAMAALHACDPAAVDSPTPTATPTPPIATATPTSTATTSPSESSPSPSPEASATATPIIGDLDNDGEITGADADWLIAELFDGDGDDASAAAGGSIASSAAADLSGDGLLTAADLVGLMERRLR